LCSFGTPILPQPLFKLRTKLAPEKKGTKKIISWVYKNTYINLKYLEVEKYMRETIDGMQKKTNPNEANLPNKDVILVKVLYQNKVGETFKGCKDKVDYPKDANL